MQIARAFDSCFVAAYNMYSDNQRTAANAIAIVFFTLLFYWLDIVVYFDNTGLLLKFGWQGKNTIFIGAVGIALLLIPYFYSRASAILNDKNLASSQYRFFRYIFFCSPVVLFFVSMFSG